MSVLIHTFWCSVSFSWGECRRWLPRCRPRCRNKETEREKANMCETDGKRQTCGDPRAILLQTHYQLFYSVLDFFRCPNINILTFLFFSGLDIWATARVWPERWKRCKACLVMTPLACHYFIIIIFVISAPHGIWSLFFSFFLNAYSKVYSTVLHLYIHTRFHFFFFFFFNCTTLEEIVYWNEVIWPIF